MLGPEATISPTAPGATSWSSSSTTLYVSGESSSSTAAPADVLRGRNDRRAVAFARSYITKTCAPGLRGDEPVDERRRQLATGLLQATAGSGSSEAELLAAATGRWTARRRTRCTGSGRLRQLANWESERVGTGPRRSRRASVQQRGSKQYEKGNTTSMRSSACSKPRYSTIDSVFAWMLLCVTRTALGAEVVPDVSRSMASSSAPTSAGAHSEASSSTPLRAPSSITVAPAA